MNEPIEEEAAQTIIPGAAYLWRLPHETVLTFGQADGTTRDANGLVWPAPVPGTYVGDFILLYAPGDEVDNSGWYIESPRTRRLDIEITHRESLDV